MDNRVELINQAVNFNLPRHIAEKKSDNWLSLFVEIATINQGRHNQERGSSGLEAGAMVRRNYGV